MAYVCTIKFYETVKKMNLAVFSDLNRAEQYHTKWNKSGEEQITWYHLY